MKKYDICLSFLHARENRSIFYTEVVEGPESDITLPEILQDKILCDISIISKGEAGAESVSLNV